MSIRRQTILQASLALFVFGLLRLVLSVASQAAIVGAFGLSHETDAFVLALSVPKFVGDSLLGGVLFFALIPTVVSCREHAGDEAVKRLVSVLFTIATTVLLLGTLLLYFFPEQAIIAVAPRIEPDQRDLAVALARTLAPMFLLFGLSIFFTALLQAYRHFVYAAAAATLPAVCTLLACVFLAEKHGIIAIAWAALVGGALQLVVLMLACAKFAVVPRPTLRWHHEALPTVGRIVVPTAVITLIGNAPFFFQRAVASDADGVVAALDLGLMIGRLPLALVVAPVVGAVFPALALEQARDNQKALVDCFDHTLRLLHFAVVPILLLMALQAQPFIDVLFARGDFDTADVEMAATAIVMLAAGILFWGQSELINRAFFALQRPRYVIESKIAWLIVCIGLTPLIYPKWQIGGLAIAISAGMFAAVLVLFVRFNSQVSVWRFRATAVSAIRLMPALAVLALVVIASDYLPVTGIIHLAGTSAVAALAYCAVAHLSGLKEPGQLIALLRSS